jgi:hypothetical protein
VQGQVVRNEKMMAPAVGRAAAADVPLRLSSRVDLSAARGILRAITEERVSHVVVGWSGQISTSRRIFGTVLDQLLTHSNQMLLVCKISHPLQTMRRLIIILPPNADHEPGFEALLRTIKVLCRQIGVSLHLLASQGNMPDLRRHVDQVKPAIPATYLPYIVWPIAADTLPDITDEDLIVVVSARQHTVSWNPYLDRIPARLAIRFPHLSFIIAYPALARTRPAPTLS